jgi:hypothetical protein
MPFSTTREVAKVLSVSLRTVQLWAEAGLQEAWKTEVAHRWNLRSSDEVQHVHEVFAFVRSRIDRQPRRTGQWLLTGSQEAPPMQQVTESMARCAAVLAPSVFHAREAWRTGDDGAGPARPTVFREPRASG